jgi:hypothetical protein
LQEQVAEAIDSGMSRAEIIDACMAAKGDAKRQSWKYYTGVVRNAVADRNRPWELPVWDIACASDDIDGTMRYLREQGLADKFSYDDVPKLAAALVKRWGGRFNAKKAEYTLNGFVKHRAKRRAQRERTENTTDSDGAADYAAS